MIDFGGGFSGRYSDDYRGIIVLGSCGRHHFCRRYRNAPARDYSLTRIILETQRKEIMSKMSLRLFFLSIVFVASSSLLCAQVAAPLPDGSARESYQLSLQQLRDSALHNNIAIRQAYFRKEASKEQRKEAFTNYFPQISAVGMTFRANREMAKMDIDPSEYIAPELGAVMAQSLPMEALAALNAPVSMLMMKQGSLAGVTALQPLFAGGQILFGNKLAKIGECVSDLQLKLTENEVEEQVEQYYWQLVSMKEKARTIDAVDSMLTQICRDVETAVKAGVALRNDLLQVQLRQNDIQSQRLKLSNGQALVKMLLAQFCGLQDEWDAEIPDISHLDRRLVLHFSLNTSYSRKMLKQPRCSARWKWVRTCLLWQ